MLTQYNCPVIGPTFIQATGLSWPVCFRLHLLSNMHIWKSWWFQPAPCTWECFPKSCLLIINHKEPSPITTLKTMTFSSKAELSQSRTDQDFCKFELAWCLFSWKSTQICRGSGWNGHQMIICTFASTHGLVSPLSLSLLVPPSLDFPLH